MEILYSRLLLVSTIFGWFFEGIEKSRLNFSRFFHVLNETHGITNLIGQSSQSL